MLMNPCSLRHSLRSVPLKLSMYPFWLDFPGSMGVELHAAGIGPGFQRVPCELRAVVGPDLPGKAPFGADGLQDLRHPVTTDGTVHLDG